MQNFPPGYEYYGGPPGYPPPIQNYGQHGGPSAQGAAYGSVNPPPPGVEEPDFGAALAEEFIHRCKSDKRKDKSLVFQPSSEEEFIRKCKGDRQYSTSQLLSEEDFIRRCRAERSVSKPLREEEFIKMCRSVSRPPREEEFIRKCRSVSRLPDEEEFIRKCRVDRKRSVSPLPLEEEFIRKCKSGSRPPPEEEFIRQCKAGSRSIRPIKSPSRPPTRSVNRHRSRSRSPLWLSKSPIRSRSKSPIRLSKSRIRSRSKSPRLSKSRIRSRSRSPVSQSRSIRATSRRVRSPSKSLIRGLSRSPVRSTSSLNSLNSLPHSRSRTRSRPPRERPSSPRALNRSGRSISPRRERLSSRSQSRSSRVSQNREIRRSASRDVRKSNSSAAPDETADPKTKRKELVDRWNMNGLSKDEVSSKLEEIRKMKPEDIIEKEKTFWTRTAPADLYYEQTEENPRVYRGTEKLIALCKRFETELVQRAARANEKNPPYTAPTRRHKVHHHRCCATNDSGSEGSSGGSEDDDEGLMEELERKRNHPDRLHPELWYNDQGEMNDGPLCRCSAKAKRSGIRHNIYAGELNLEKCNVFTNNADRLYHYRITVSPPNNFLIKTPTIIEHDNHEYIFEGFSLFSHKLLEDLPVCKVIRFNIEYTILYIKEKHPEHFIIKELDLFYDFLFKEILEMVDLDFKAAGDSNGCSQFHFMPRFVRELPENGKELLSMNQVLNHLLLSSKPLIPLENLAEIVNLSNYKWQNYVDDVKGMVVTYPGKKPCSLRVDQLDRDQRDAKPGELKVPEIVHFGIRPPQLSYAGNPEYQKAWREYVKFRHLLANMPKASFEDKRKLESKENKLQEMRMQSKMKRDVTIAISSEGFYRTGIMCDMVQHAMLIPVLVAHLRFHRSLDVLEADIKYTFKNRYLLQLALTHPSYRENFGTNPDHARNSLTNCSIRQPEYGDRRIHYLNTRKRGINTLINIMSRFGKNHETESNITHNERLEFLGDAVVEFVTSIHLFHLFPRLEEGGLATYRAAIVQNQHLAVLAKKLGLDEYMLYAHGSDLCHDLELRHAMANCFEALMGALFLDGEIEAADRVFGESLFKESPIHLKIWEEYPPHPLQEQEPNGDRQWIEKFQILQNLTKFEDSIGVKFTHIRLLARALTDRSIGFTNLTLGSNQRLEFLGDTVLQLIASDYLYKFFPEHHEGHLSLLRSSLVNNRTQAVVCDDLGIGAYAIYATPKAELKTKDRADLLEAFLGALYVDKGLHHCEVFCNVCFFPRLHDFIMHQDWNDPKSKLQQCCLTLRTMEGGEPEIPIYKVIECMGPTNTRLYTVAVYFKGKRLAQATGHSIQQAEMNAAKEALDNSQKLFPQLDHQKRVIAKSIKQDPLGSKDTNKRGQSDVSDGSRKIVRLRNARGRCASGRGLKTRASSAPGKKHLQSPEESRKNDQDPSKTSGDHNRQWSPGIRSSLTRNPSRQRSLSPTPNPSKTKSPSPKRRKSQLRSSSQSRSRISRDLQPRSPSPLNKRSEQRCPSPPTATFCTQETSPSRSPIPCKSGNQSPLLEQSMLSHPRSRSSSPLRKESHLRKSPHNPTCPNLSREQYKLRGPLTLGPRSPSPIKEQIKLRSASPQTPRSPSLPREQSKQSIPVPGRSRSQSIPRKQIIVANPKHVRPRGPSPIRVQIKLRSPSPHEPRSSIREQNKPRHRTPSIPRSPSQTKEQSKERSTVPGRSRSPSLPREQIMMRNSSHGRPRSPTPIREQINLRSASPHEPNSPSPLRKQSEPRKSIPSMPKSPSPIRDQSKQRNWNHSKPRSPSLLREQRSRKRYSPSSRKPRSPSQPTEQSKQRSPVPGRPRSPSLLREQRSRKRYSPSSRKPRSPSPLKKRSKVKRSISPHEQSNLSSSYIDRRRSRSPMSPKEPLRSSSHYRGSSRMKSPSPEQQYDHHSSSWDTNVPPRKESMSRHETSGSTKNYPADRLHRLLHRKSPDQCSRPKMSSPTKERFNSKSPKKPFRPDRAEPAIHCRKTSDYQEHGTKNIDQRYKSSGSKQKDEEGERSRTVDQNRHTTRSNKFDQRKRPRMEEISPEKRRRESDSKRRRSKSRDRESMKYNPAERLDKRAMSYYGYPVDTNQKDYHPNQQNMASYERHLDNRATKDSHAQEQMKAYYEDYHKTLAEFRQQQQQKKNPQDLILGQQQTKQSPERSRLRREPSDEGEIVSESSVDSRYS